MIIVKRFDDERRIKRLSLPLFVYGRRKTGKTFLIKHLFRNALYFFVRRDRTIYYERRSENIRYDELLRIIEEGGRIVIVDEFHRLGDDFLDFLHMKQPRNIILITSTLNLAKKIISNRSPILGIFMEFKLDTISEKDILLNLAKFMEGKELVERCVYLKEPLLLRFFDEKNRSIDFNSLKLTIPALVGEIFSEEERVISERYEGILRAIASGRNKLNEIVAHLYSSRLISKQDIGAVKQYIKNLLDIGLIKRIREYGRNRYYYFISSPLIDLYYYLDEKYNFSETELDEKYFREKLPRYVEDFFRELLACLYGKRKFIISKPDTEIDIVLGDFNRIWLVGEVKWKERIGEAEIKNIERKLSPYNCRRVLIVPDKGKIKKKLKEVELLDVSDVMRMLQG